MAVRKPRSDAQMQRLAELFVEVDAQVAAIEEARDVAIAAANAQVDQDLAPLLKERAAIEEKLGPYFMANRERLLTGKRKSLELGGAMLGARKATEQVAVAGTLKDVVAAMFALPWARKLLKRSWSLDKAKIKAALAGERADELKALGLSLDEGEDAFFIKRTGQAGTQAKA